MKENMMKEDMMSSDVEIDEIGDTKMGEAKGVMNFPKERARVARKIMSKEMFKGLPKRWKGRGDYFFEAQDDGSLKITGGDKAKSLTGGKSTVITDKVKIKEILDKARDGDVIEEGATYEFKTRGRGSFDSPESYGKALRDTLAESTPEAEGVPRVSDGMPEEKGVSDLKESEGALRPKREYRNPTFEAANYLMQEMKRRPEIKDILQRALDALGVPVENATEVMDMDKVMGETKITANSGV
tara:strand:+ start:179 stop:904 length:726 start_codon:yes stop_codon:yes gene_type:complete